MSYLLRDLGTPLDAPYDAPVQDERMGKLFTFYGQVESSSSLRRAVCSLIRSSFWDFLALVAWTEDEADRHCPKKPFAPYPYVKHFADFATAEDASGLFIHDIIAVVKSRQLMMSWIAVMRLLHLCVCNPSIRCLIVSKTEEHGLELLARARVAYAQLPPWFLRSFGMPDSPERIFKVGEAVFPNGSKIKVLPERGGESARSHTSTFNLLDEVAFQHDFDATWTAITGGSATKRGRKSTWAISTASTAHTMLFKDLVLDWKNGVHGGVAQVFVNQRGLEIHKNKLWGINVVRLHYSADPSSALPGWVAKAQEGMDEAKWRQEMEMDFYALSGAPLFPMFDASVHILPTHPRVEVAEGTAPRIIYGDRYARATLGLGVDHGLRNPCGGILMAEEETRDLWALWDYAVAGRAAPDNARAILQGLEAYGGRELYNHIPFQAIDAMHSLADRSHLRIEDLYRYEWVPGEGGSVLQGEPLLWRMKTCVKGKGSVEAGISQLAQLLLATLAAARPDHSYWAAHNYDRTRIEDWAKRPRLLISPACTAFAEELRQGRYKDLHDPNLNQPEGEVDAHNHVRKAFSYVMQGGFRYLGG